VRAVLFACLASVAFGCTTSAPEATVPATTTFLSPTDHLVRTSMALRGVRPSLAELTAVAANANALPGIVDSYLASPEFGATIRDLHNEVLLLRIQQLDLTPGANSSLYHYSFDEIGSSYFQEPLRLIENIVMTDQPYTQIVTANYTMADPIVAAIYGMTYTGTGTSWQPTSWPDGRPAAGILVSDALHVRYRSAGFNYHRGRANAVSRSLLCHDFLTGDVVLDPSVNLADPNVVSAAVVADPSCAACHQTLDPLASYFFPFEQGTIGPPGWSYPQTIFDASTANGWFLTTNRPPAYFGNGDVVGLDGLGQAIAADPRFAQCTAIHFASYLTEVPAAQLSPVWIAELQTAFVQSGYNAKQLARAVVLSDAFRVAAASDPVAAQDTVGYQKARPAQLERMLQALTGYTWTSASAQTVATHNPPLTSWTIGPIDMLDDDLSGYRVLGGGIDSFLVTDPVFTMNATSSMTFQLAAYRAASYVVGHDVSAPPAQRTLFTAAPVTASDRASVTAELGVLHARIYGELAPSSDELAETYGLWWNAYQASGDPRRAWIVTLTGMLSDLRAVYY
jgi:hypothetical protein